MSQPVAPLQGLLRGLAPALLALGVLAVPGVPELARAAVAVGLALVGAYLVAGAGRTRLQAVHARFVPPDLTQRTVAAVVPATAQVYAPPAAPMVAAPAVTSYSAPLAPVAPVVPPSLAVPQQVVHTQRVNTDDPVYLGPTADPAFPAWQLHWQLQDGCTGVVVLPMGERVVLGRLAESHIVVVLAEVSRAHLNFAVTRAGVRVVDTGGANGSWLRKGEGRWDKLVANQSAQLSPWDQLRISDPWAIVLTLEPVSR